MRRFLWVLLILATVWCLWWLGASVALRGAVDGWLGARRAEGWQAEASAIQGGGFPSSLHARLIDLRLADPATGVALRVDPLLIAADAWWPGQVQLVLPATPIRFAAPDAQADLVMSDGIIRLDLVPQTGLPLRRLGWTSSEWAVASAAGPLIEADGLVLQMVQKDSLETYAFSINVAAARPGQVTRDQLRIPASWPLAVQSLQMNMDVTFDRPWDLRALEDRRPQPRQIKLDLAEAEWGPVRLRLSADLSVGVEGLPEGTINIQARNWRDMLDLAVTSGAVPQSLKAQAEGILASLAGLSGNPNSIDVTLQARGGLLRLGFIPVGPAPRLLLR